MTAAALRSAAMQVTRPLGFDLLRESPIVDARLEDGSRVAVAYPPATPEVAITIRRFGRKFLTADDLVGMGSLPRSVLEAMARVASSDGKHPDRRGDGQREDDAAERGRRPVAAGGPHRRHRGHDGDPLQPTRTASAWRRAARREAGWRSATW